MFFVCVCIFIVLYVCVCVYMFCVCACYLCVCILFVCVYVCFLCVSACFFLCVSLCFFVCACFECKSRIILIKSRVKMHYDYDFHTLFCCTLLIWSREREKLSDRKIVIVFITPPPDRNDSRQLWHIKTRTKRFKSIIIFKQVQSNPCI